jgi:hypothetical protein
MRFAPRQLFRALPVFGVLALSLSASPLWGQTVELRYQYAPGQELRYESITNSSTSLPGMLEMGQRMRTVVRNAVVLVDETGNARIRQITEGFNVELVTPTGVERYDSSNPQSAAGTPFASLMSTLDRPVEFVQDPMGAVVNAGNLPSMAQSLVQGMDAETRAAIDLVGGASVLEGLVGSGSGAAFGFPAEGLSVGDIWEIETSMPLPLLGTLSQRQMFTFAGIDEEDGRRIARIVITGQLGALAADGSNPLASLLSMSGGGITGQMRFDLDRGILIEQVVETRMNMAAMGMELVAVNRMETRLIP